VSRPAGRRSGPRAVVFDFYGTLARWADSHLSNYTAVFAAHGYALSDRALEAYFARYDGVEHREHSINEVTYERWVRHRLTDLTTACGVAPEEQHVVMDALRASDHGSMLAYPEAAATLRMIRRGGLGIGVCSNWGWELNAYLRQVELGHLVDASVTSARAGARKPHPSIYVQTSTLLGVDPKDVVFVGDSWVPDVEGPRRLGMTPVHVWRADERSGQTPPALGQDDYRIPDLTGLLEILNLS
jgi:putative hydrolase of the HAD superfamily